MKTAVIVDVDGTLCDVASVLHHVQRTPKDFDAFHAGSADCPPHTDVIRQVVEHHRGGHTIVVVTARMYRWEDVTRDWLTRHLPVPHLGPFMRGDRDYRPDVEVKRDIHRVLTTDHGLSIVQAIDDSPAIIELWEQLGIPTTVVPGWSG